MSELCRPAMLICLVMLVPILPFLAFGPQIEQWVSEWSEKENAALITASVIVGLLSTDILLPIPSSMISTFGGIELGPVWGTAVSWLGMTIGAVLGFALSRRWGYRFAHWFTKEEDLSRMQHLSDRFGPAALVMARGVPVLAEASVLLMGIHRLTWRRFLPPVLLANLALSVAYSAFGHIAEQNQWLPLALGVSIALPVLLATLVKRWFVKKERAN